MKKNITLSLLALLLTFTTAYAQTTADWQKMEKTVNFIIGNDLGRNGYYDQKPIADVMGRIGEAIGIDCVAAPGDIHHFLGVRSTQDPLWMTNYELIYSHPELMLHWYPTLGNHEYRGNTQAVLDYSNVSARWTMPARYYTEVLEGGKGDKHVTVRLVFLDTTPMMDKYRNDTDVYPDACKQDYQRQLQWADSVLTVANEDWVVVLGHHPIYADTGKDKSERADMQQRLDPILRKHRNVSFYVCGHIHNFQHLRMKGSDIDYVVNSSGSLSRQNVNKVEGTVFCDGRSGFSLACADKHSLSLHFMDKTGTCIYTIDKQK